MSDHSKYPKEAGIYKLTCSDNGKVYIGKSVNIHVRLINHKSYENKSKGKCYFQNAIIKYGWNAFTVEIIEIFENFDKLKDNDSLLSRESYYIELFDSANVDKGYNLCKYSNDMTGRKLSEETKEKMRKPKSEEHIAKMRNRPCSKETRDKIRQSQIGRQHSEESKEKMRRANIGKKLSEETKEKIGKAGKGRRHSKEAKEKMRLANMGKKHSEETKEKLRNISEEKREETRQMGKSNLGRKHSDETKKKISEAGKKNSGKHHSEETKEKMRLSHQKRWNIKKYATT